MIFALPAMQSAADAAKGAAAVLAAVAIGDLTPAEGASIMALVEAYRRTLETSELEARMVALEARATGGHQMSGRHRQGTGVGIRLTLNRNIPDNGRDALADPNAPPWARTEIILRALKQKHGVPTE